MEEDDQQMEEDDQQKECAYCEETLKGIGYFNDKLNARVCRKCQKELKKRGAI